MTLAATPAWIADPCIVHRASYRGELLRHNDAIDRIWVQLREKAKKLPRNQTERRRRVRDDLTITRVTPSQLR